MPGGRPRRDAAQPHPELDELAAWFRASLEEAGYPSVNAFVLRQPFDKNSVYGLVNGTRFLTLDACRAVAVALRRDVREIDPLWWRAKQTLERRAASQHDAERVVSWDALPWPPVALQDILEAQAQAVDMLPYRLLGVEPPPLSSVYVRQQARTQVVTGKTDRQDPRSEPTPDRETPAVEKAIPVTAALDRHEHLVLTGEPGAGKSTFGQYLALRLSEIWLRTATGEHPPVAEPLVPIRVPARTLVGARSWAAGLAAATQLTLGLRLVSEPQPALFERRVLGVRWLVIVDGLDEIVDRAARTEVIQALAARCRPDGDYRIVVTTRQLPDVEFALLRSQHVQTYAVEPFGREELVAFAGHWFTAQKSPDPAQDASRFLRHTVDGRLRELVRNPLLATIAAISYTLAPHRPLPRSRLELYERFFEHLLDEDSGGRHTIAELRRINAGNPLRVRFADWLHESRPELLQHLGRVRLEGGDSLLEAALSWVDSHLPPDLGHSAGRPEDVRVILLGTGLLVYEGDRLRFLHHSFAEFLAAQEHAAGVGSEFTGLDTWIAKGILPAEREFVLFLFAQWCRRPGHEVALLVDRMLVGDAQRALLAGRLLAERPEQQGVPRAQVLKRLFNLLLFHSAHQESGGNADPASVEGISDLEPEAVVEVLGDFVDDQEVIRRLGEVADDARLPRPTRIAAIRALGRCDDPAGGLGRLKRLAAQLHGLDLLEAARLAITLGPDDALGQNLLESLCRDSDLIPQVRADAVVELSGLGASTTAGPIARDLLFGNELGFERLERVVGTWLESLSGEESTRTAGLAELLDEVSLSARQCASVAEALVKVGLHVEADRVAMEAMRKVADVGWPVQSMLAAWMRPGHRHLGEVVELIRRMADPRGKAYAIRGLADTACIDETVMLAQELTSDPGADGYTVSLSVTSWLTAQGASALEPALTAVRKRGFSGIRWSFNIPTALTEAGFPAAAADLVREQLDRLAGDGWDLGDSVRAWLKASGPEVAHEILAAIERRGTLSLQGRAFIAQAFAMEGCLAAADRLVAGVIELPDLGINELAPVAKALVLTHGQAGAETVLKMVERRDVSSMDRIVLAEHLAAAGHLDAAHHLWCSVLTRPTAPLAWISVAVDRLVSTGATDSALAAVEAHDSPSVTVRGRIVRAAAEVNQTRD